MSVHQNPTNASHPIFAFRVGSRLKRAILPFAIVSLAVGISYSVYRVIRSLERQKEMAEIAALVSSEMQSLAQSTNTESPPAQEGRRATDVTVNRMLADMSFEDLSGGRGSFKDYRGSVLVVSMTSVGCPISKKLVPALARLAQDFRDNGVKFLLVNTDQDASRSDLEAHAKLFPGWRYVPDADSHLARTLGARTTTETFVIDTAQTLRYRGAVDDRFDVGVNREATGPGPLQLAVAAVLHNEPFFPSVTDAPGCVLGLSSTDRSPSPVTWHNQISRLVRYNCVECHRPGEAAPFALETYAQVVSKKAMIEYVLDNRIMPPWFADYSHGNWRNVRSVSDADRQMFTQWVAAGCIEGDPADAPVPPKLATGWTIRQPDIVIDVEPQELPAEGRIPWRKFPVAFDVPEDLWVSEAEIRPSVPEVVHHAMLFIEYPKDDPRRSAQTRAEAQSSGGGDGFWLSYFPGRKAMSLPPGRAKLIPKNGRIFIQLHYTPNGTPLVDKTRIGLKLLPGPPEKVVVSSAVRKRDLLVPPNSLARLIYSEVLGEDIRLLALMPHMHYRGSAAQVFVKYPDGRFDTVLNVPKFDFDWQVSYEFVEPMLLTRGSTIVIRHEFDNTATNPNNPDATKELRHGNNVNDEMMINFFDWEPAGDDKPRSRKKLRPFQ
jgi:thiol-disulfide isomerase/thioredoxin